ncbi:DNA gyrase subunit A [Candidatus Woesearchaeota archaeon]|nr:DNA gyrase subunit A [Candidatus Woesearchaeota archaeon]MBT5271866.1 DNA gyrase subunit A [Candidatus Woesearchaeota archaeon]MBT6041670.1 DNA gyrase subunit A [Candidatus Woesearchaeota archaeon]MBT6337354.1 DNA gyrase subunit A [Candidatus Woesearchaeota archaeon]MBT7927602.1 DNA gyrase subunit A [Candidatus Woesearchaeota archaeon]
MPEDSGEEIEQKSTENEEKIEPQNTNPEPEEPVPEKGISPIMIEDEMKNSYIDYAMSVIVGRALPDVRDGLKPVHRRILYAMNDMGMLHNKPYKKSARIVGECLGKYHPHGDQAVYDSMVRMAQSFSLRYPLVDGHGNWGSIDGDRAAAMRYTEARLKKISEEILQDIEKETVNFTDNFDGSLKEPTVLPCKFPNLLINGSSGIAVGMATNVPPHNILETCDAIIQIIDNPEISIREIMEVVKGPDFPTGGIICGKQGIGQAYTTGRGRVIVRGKTHIEKHKERERIIIDEIPYMTNKSLLIEHIADSVRSKVIEGISDIRDESDKRGMRVVIELKRDANHEVVLNQLFKHSRLQSTFGIIMLALVNNEPKILNLKELMMNFIGHRKQVVTRRTQYELKKAEERAHILEGLKVALADIDKTIAIIKKSKDAATARAQLIEVYSLTEKQAQAILDMKLQKITSLETEKILEEFTLLMEKIENLKNILDSEERIRGIIKNELTEIMDKYGDVRRTEILENFEEEIEIEDLIEEEDMVVTISHAGYIKRIPLTMYKAQGRGGKGIIAATTKEEDFVENLFVANTHDYLLVFTDKGIVHWIKVFRLPEGSRQARGKAIINLIGIEKDSKVTAFIPVKQFDPNHFLVMVTKNGTVKKTSLSAFSKPRQGGIRAINIETDNELVNVLRTDGDKQIIVATSNGQAVKFNEKNVRPMGRASFGVRGIKLKETKDSEGKTISKDYVVGGVIADDNKTLLTVTEHGYGKRTTISEYRLINRGGSGVKNIICSERNGGVVAIKSVTNDDEVMLISQKGIIIRTRCNLISTIGRNTQGVRLMRLGAGDKVVATAKIIGEDRDVEDVIEEEETSE